MIAMILAAGRGERMRPLTDRMPKPLLEAGGRPLIVHLLEALAAAGCRELVVNTAHLGRMLEDALGSGERHGVRIAWSHEGEALETAGGIACARPLLGDQPFLVVNGDVWTDLDFGGFIARAGAALARPACEAYLLLVDNPRHHPDGDFRLAGDRVVDEACADAAAAPKYTFAGIGAYRPRLFDGVEPGAKAPLAPLLFAARARGAVSGEHFGGGWMDIGTPQRLADLDRRLRDGLTAAGSL
ncbi:MAG: nucleotidyltransferase family protein [Betaproteobacteria bacterium]|jgi:MurNAc alpha-1-phosphate uridylyltransferase|nr:nucleotidyltransferase family protein [Betaproteobacteria bacterium]